MDSIAEMVELARLAESAGFDLAWSWEFFNKNAFVRLAAMAAATTRIGLGTGIAYAFGRAPLLTAAAAADGLVGHPIYPRSYIRDHVRPAVDDGLRRAGRPRDSFTVASCVIVS